MDSSKVICIDCDGVLTDNKIWVTHTGEITKSFNSKDLTAIKELIANGYEVHIVTASSWPGTANYMSKSGATVHTIRNKESIPFHYDIAVGDSSWDVPMFERCVFRFCPADADEYIRIIDGMNVLKTNGGAGVIAELVRLLVK